MNMLVSPSIEYFPLHIISWAVFSRQPLSRLTTFKVFILFFLFIIIKMLYITKQRIQQRQTKDSTYNITNTKENKNKIKNKDKNIKLTPLTR